MSFELKNDQEKNNSQLSLFDYQLPKANFVPSKDDSDYNTWLMAQQKPQNKAGRFVTMSAFLHVAAVLSLSFFAVPMAEKIETETISIDLQDDVPPVKFAEAPKGAPVVPSQGNPVIEEKPVAKLEVKEVTTPEDVVMPAKAEAAPVVAALPEKVKALPPKAKVEKAVVAPKPATVAAVKSGSVAAKSNFTAVPMTVDDIEAPELDKGELAATPVDSNLNEDFNEDFAHVDNAQKQVLDKEQEKIAALATAVSQEQDENLKAVDSANAEEAEKLTALQERVRQKNADAVAAALASDKAAAEAKAREQAAARDAAAKKAALAAASAAAAAKAGNEDGQGTNEGKGAGNNGNPAVAEAQAAGQPEGVRSLDQLRQMPGNLRPQYEREERLRGDKGAVIFYAYISKEGHPSQFRLVKSTGFRNLDKKTLSALKQWRFYPGQEGWVELPFRWDLKGGAEEDGGRLRAAAN